MAFADFMTAMFALFLVLWLVNQSSDVKSAIAGYFQDPLGRADEFGSSILPGRGRAVVGAAAAVAGAGRSTCAATACRPVGDEIDEQLRDVPDLKEVSDKIEIEVTEEGLRIQLLEDANGTFYKSGSAELSDRGTQLLTLLGGHLGKLTNQIRLEGFTDSQPFTGRPDYSNWELSADRANAARRVLTAGGMKDKQLQQVRGLADRELKDPEGPVLPPQSPRRHHRAVADRRGSRAGRDRTHRRGAGGGGEASRRAGGREPGRRSQGRDRPRCGDARGDAARGGLDPLRAPARRAGWPAMIARGTVLVSGARESTAPVRLLIEQLGGRIVLVTAGESVIAGIEHERPDVVVMPVTAVSGVFERALARERHACALVGMISGSAHEEVAGEHELFDATVPLDAGPETRERLRLALLLGRARREAHDIGREVGRLRQATSAGVQRLTGLLLAMLDRRHPGSTERSAHLAELCLQVAERFGVPEDMLPALDLAARLREVGRLVLPPEGGGPGDPAWEWSVTKATSQLLESFPELAHSVELLTGVHENWDGTGHPGHLMSGQIPMRSRILRAASEYLRLRAAHDAPPPSQVLEQLASHAGTLYDPLVIVHLRSALESSAAPANSAARVYLPVPELQVGMVLAEDLYTDSGMKLLSRGTVLAASALEVILRRHSQEPMYRGVGIQRRTGN